LTDCVVVFLRDVRFVVSSVKPLYSRKVTG